MKANIEATWKPLSLQVTLRKSFDIGLPIFTPFTLVFPASSLQREPTRKANGEELSVSEVGLDSPGWSY